MRIVTVPGLDEAVHHRLNRFLVRFGSGFLIRWGSGLPQHRHREHQKARSGQHQNALQHGFILAS
jgi:hypothetical protein